MDESKKATETLTQVIAEGMNAGLKMAADAATSTVDAINASGQKDINVTSKFEYERTWGFRENARNFIYPERVGMVYSL